MADVPAINVSHPFRYGNLTTGEVFPACSRTRKVIWLVVLILGGLVTLIAVLAANVGHKSESTNGQVSKPENRICKSWEYRCENGDCIIGHVGLRCDGRRDCDDGSDEWCDKTKPPTPDSTKAPLEPDGCGPFRVKCLGLCIYGRRCDGVPQCLDGSDEMNCPSRTCSKNHFKCDGRCIRDSAWCDGHTDCRISGMDEQPNCKETCPPDLHPCKNQNGHCLNESQVCDGIPNCYDWSDELNCPHVADCKNFDHPVTCIDPPVCLHPLLWCTGSEMCREGATNPEGCECNDLQFDCVVGARKCIPKESVCDGVAHCADKRDETDCGCSYPKRRCDSGLCLDRKLFCNGIDDCGDMSDEHGCSCRYDQIHCDDRRSCVNKDQWCDGFPNCEDGSDEKPGCKCLSGQFECDGFCLPHSKRCDGMKDCTDNSDEASCGFTLCDQVMGFRCKESKECIPPNYRCDGHPQCKDHSDETDCRAHCHGQFVCDNGRCLPHEYKCDQYDNCGDNSDERHCTYECLEEEFQCANGKCIPRTWLCDQTEDCDGGDDEEQKHCVNCGADEKPCRGGQTCYQPSQTCDGVEQCSRGEDEYHCVYLDKKSAEKGEALVIKANKGNVAYDGICSVNWSESTTTTVCQYLGYESGQRHSFINAPPGSTLLSVSSSNVTTRNLVNQLSPMNDNKCLSGQIVSVKCISKECGNVPLHSNAFSPYIINGEDAEPGKWPWQVLMENTDLKAGMVYSCGGSVINRYWVAIAAHCVSSEHGVLLHPETFTIQVGVTRRGIPDRNTRLHKVDKLIVHPSYNSLHADHDIALIRVTRPIQYTDYVQPICLPDSRYNVSRAAECYISGWGVDSLLHTSPTHLKQAKVDILQADYCNKIISDGAGTRLPLTVAHVKDDIELCVGFPPKPIGACFGDSGGPLMCRDEHYHWTLVGVTSHLNGLDCTALTLSTYTRVSVFADWIRYQMSQNPPLRG